MEKNSKMKCKNCGNKSFQAQDGLQFCTECGMQLEGFQMEADDEYRPNAHQKIHLAEEKARKARRENYLKSKQKTSFEEYNLILLGLVNEIQQINSIPNFKTTVLQLWITYLKKIEAAFHEDDGYWPKLHTNYRDADAVILFNKKSKAKKRKPQAKKTIKPETEQQKRRAMKKSEKAISQQLSDSIKSESMNSSSVFSNLSLEVILAHQEEEEQPIEFNQRAMAIKHRHGAMDETVKVNMKKMQIAEKILSLNSRTLFYIISCALNVCKSDIQLSDLIRFIREGHFSLHSVVKFLPDDYLELGVSLSHNNASHNHVMIDDMVIRHQLAVFAQFIPDLTDSFEIPNMMMLIRRYVADLNLPKDIERFAENLVAIHPPKMKFRVGYPNYEGRAMAFVVFILKLLFGLDGYREINMSKAAEKVQESLPDDVKIFNYMKWKEHIEYRKVIMQQFYYCSVYHEDYNGIDSYKIFNAMNDALKPDKSKFVSSEGLKQNNKYSHAKMNLVEIVDSVIDVHRRKSKGAVNNFKKYMFEPSLTPYRDYFEQIIESETGIDLTLAGTKFKDYSCELYLKPKKLVQMLQSAEKSVKVEKAKFPPHFRIFDNFEDRQRKTHPDCYRCFYELQTSTQSFSKWKKDFGKSRKEIKLEIEQAVREDDQEQTEKVIQRRRFWRQRIAAHQKQPGSEDCMFLSDSDSDGDNDATVDDVFSKNQANNSREEVDSDETIKFFTPDFNMWRFKIHHSDQNMQINPDLELLPKSFRWLLNTAAHIVHQPPQQLYDEVADVEYQFMMQLQPMELVDNVLLSQNEIKLAPIERAHKCRYRQKW